MSKKLKLGIYEHFKGGRYRVLGVAKHSETGEELVVYQNIDDIEKIWARPLSMFTESIERDGKKMPRFKFIEPA